MKSTCNAFGLTSNPELLATGTPLEGVEINQTMVFRLSLCFVLGLPWISSAQDRLAGMPGAKQFQTNAAKYASPIRRGDASVVWVDGGNALVWDQNGKRTKLDLKSGKAVEFTGQVPADRNVSGPNSNSRRQRPERGRQFSEAFSPDGTLKAFTRDGNCWIAAVPGGPETQITKDGDPTRGIKYATGTWVYGEELGQREAMGFSSDGKKLWFYRFDESMVQPYYLAYGQTAFQSTLDSERYPKAGAPNPVADVMLYDTATKRLEKVAVRPGPFDEALGHYVYAINFSPDGKELRFHRTNRWQNVMEWCGVQVDTGKMRTIVREEWTPSWTDNQPARVFLDDHPDIEKAPQYKGKALWTSERNGYENYYLLDLKTGILSAITAGQYEAAQIVKTDLLNGVLWYMARDGDNPYKLQLHRVGLDGKGDKRLTDPAFHHTVNLSPNSQFFVDTFEALDIPPTTVVRDLNGKIIETLANSDLTKFKAEGLQFVERLKFKAADGKTDIYGTLIKPSNFDPQRKYPVLVQVYGGPDADSISERFTIPSSISEYGFLIARFAGRGSRSRGKKFKDEMYLKLGITEIDDQAAGVKYLISKPYVDAKKIGIEGTSYGGYASVMAILRYPELFAAAAAQSSVTDWRHYDTIYTERYMRTPQANPQGYEAGSAIPIAKNLKGRLMLYFGTSDNNVHPANTFQLVRALQRAGKHFELQAGPDQGHTGLNFQRMMEFFIERMVMEQKSIP